MFDPFLHHFEVNKETLDPALAAELGVDDPELAAAIEASYKIDHPAIEEPSNRACIGVKWMCKTLLQ